MCTIVAVLGARKSDPIVLYTSTYSTEAVISVFDSFVQYSKKPITIIRKVKTKIGNKLSEMI